MNTCILAVKVVRNPQLRYTQENQTPVAEMLVEFEGLGSNDSPATLRVVGWGNLATRFPEEYSVGDSLIIEGRLSMRVIERPEGYKEKKAELIASRIHPMTVNGFTPTSSPKSANSSDNVVELGNYQGKSAPPPQEDDSYMEETSAPSEGGDTDLDDIPF